MLYQICRLFLKPIYSMLYRLRLEGKENIPRDGSYLICANHESAIDPILIAVVFPRKIYSMAKAELFKNKLLSWLLHNIGVFPIKRGEADIKSIKTALKLLGGNNVLGVFPEGTRNKTGELIAEPGIAMLAVKSKVPVLPLAIVSEYKLFRRSVIRIGQPISLEHYYNEKLHNEDYVKISLEVMKNIRQLKKG